MQRIVARALAAGLLLIGVAGATHAQVVISQVYGAGGNTGATYNRDFVELFNRGSTPVSLSGLTVQYASATGTGNFAVGATLPNVNLAPGQYHLVGMSSGANGAALPTVDTSGTSSMATAAGKVVLANSTTALACNGNSTPCSAGQLALIVDLVGYGNANFFEGAAAAPTLSATLSALRSGNGCNDTNQNGADFASGTPSARNSASPASVCGGGGSPFVSINDVANVETDSDTTAFFFAFGLSQPAGPGGVTITYSTANGTATAGSDYIGTGGTVVIAEGDNAIAFSVMVNGDTTPEADETFFVNIDSVTGAIVADGQGQGTIQNDDVTLVQIHDIQGNGIASPLNGAVVTTEGIVTAQKFNNGFFLQTADASVDADPNTSQGIFVFTSTAPPATAAVGNRIRVSGTVTEFTPTTNLNQLSITEIVSVTSIQVLSTGNALPAPVTLTASDFGAGAQPGTAEKYEGMRVNVASARAISGADGNISESSANASTTGVFHIALDGVARPFREPGISVMDVFPIPGGKNPPRFDTNQERIMVRSRGQIGATAVAVDADAIVTGVTGVLDYFSGTWAILPDPGAITVAGGKIATAVEDARYEDVTIGGFNLLRFFDEVNDSNGAPTLQAAALDKRLTKTSLAICDYMKAPDVLGVVEVENLRVLGLLADRINATCARAPQYVPYLVQGNDPGGINVGFLVSTRASGANARVEVLGVTQFGKNTLFTNPDSSTALLNDRPPLLLRARIHQDNGASYPIAVIVNHLRSLNGIDDTSAGSSGWATEGHRVRAKRGQQALFLANLVHSMQVADPNEHIVLLGDFNAFEFSDGYVDLMGIITGEEPPANEVINDIDSPITTPLVDGSELIADPADSYSYVFEGSAQTLDHVVVNEALVMDVDSVSVDHARINADFGVHNFGVAGNAIRVSDHDPVRVVIGVRAFRSMDLVAGATTSTSSVDLGSTASFIATIRNEGPSENGPVAIAMVFNALVTPAVSSPNGDWTCAAPVQGGTTTTVTCTAASLVTGVTVDFPIEVPATDPALTNGTLRMDVAVSSSNTDPANANNQASASANILAFSDMGVTLTAPPASAIVGETISIVADVSNEGPQPAPFASVAFVFNTLVSPAVSAPAGWTCSAPTQDATTTTVTCTIPTFASGATVQFAINVPTNGAQQSDWTLQIAAAARSQYPDDVSANDTATVSTQVRVFADLDALASTSTPSVDPGQTANLSFNVHNNGPAAIANATSTFTFNALVTPTITAPNGWTCNAPSQSVSDTTVTCTGTNVAPGTQSIFSAAFLADAALSGRDITATVDATSVVSDPFPGNNRASTTIRVRALPNADLSLRMIGGPSGFIRSGTNAQFSVPVRNAGPNAATQTVVTFSGNSPLASTTVAAPAGWSCVRNATAGGHSIVCTLGGTFAVNARATFTYTATAPSHLSQSTLNLNSSVGASGVSDPLPGNNAASYTVNIVAP